MQKPRETQVKSLGSEGPLEEEMATHSSFLAAINSWTQEHLEGYSTWVAKSWTELSMHTLYMCLCMLTVRLMSVLSCNVFVCHCLCFKDDFV